MEKTNGELIAEQILSTEDFMSDVHNDANWTNEPYCDTWYDNYEIRNS